MITIISDAEYVKNFLLHPDIWKYAAQPFFNKKDLKINIDKERLYLDYEGIGLIDVHAVNNATVEIHPYIRREYKDRYNKMIKEFFNWFIDNIGLRTQKINAIIPDYRKGAINAARIAGFTKEGVNRLSCWGFDNKLHDQIMYGITREEIVKWVI